MKKLILKNFKEAVKGTGVLGGGTYLRLTQVGESKFTIVMQDSGGMLEDVRTIERFDDLRVAMARYNALAADGFVMVQS